MQKKELYFLDFYVPNDGEPDSALEVGILRQANKNSRPTVFLHSFITPVSFIRVRWNHAHEQGIDRSMIQAGQGILPTQKDLLSRNYLSGKEVVCLNPNLEPCKSFIKDAYEVHGIITTWQEVFHDDEEAQRLLKPSQMLEYLGFPVSDDSNTRYTALLSRLFSLIAIWTKLAEFKKNPKNIKKSKGQLPISPVWPIPNHEDLNILSVDSFEQVSAHCVRSFFSSALPDYLDWYGLNIYHHDWSFYKKPAHDIQHLKGRKSMADFLFNQVLSYRIRIWVLIFYALYDRKLEYSCEIALKKGDFKQVQQSVYDDFSNFLIAHLQEFLDEDQKLHLVRSIIHSGLKQRAALPYQEINYEEFEKLYKNDSLRNMSFNVATPPNCSIKAFKEIRENQGVLYRRYEISGDETQRAGCITLVNELFKKFLHECSDPFSNYWTDSDIRHWISYIYGYTWDEFRRETGPADGDYLLQARSLIVDVMASETEVYVKNLKQLLTNVINEINQNIVSDYVKQFSFMGTSIDIVISKRQGSFIKRIFKL